jgi:DNA-directed RNA polymerase subunit N (RpoN/RPB10)
MALPVRCFTCGKVVGDKWETYFEKCKELGPDSDELDTKNKRKESPDGKTERGKILDELGINMMCCRTVMLTTVDMSTII